MASDNGTDFNREPPFVPEESGDTSEYYGILIVAAVFFSVIALSASVYLRQRRLRLSEAYAARDINTIAGIMGPGYAGMYILLSFLWNRNKAANSISAAILLFYLLYHIVVMESSALSYAYVVCPF